MKGSMLDILIIGITLLAFSITILVAYVVMVNVQTTMGPQMMGAEAANALSQGVAAVQMFDYSFTIIFVGLGLASVIFAFLVPSHPIFIALSVLMLLIDMIVLPQFSNMYESVRGNGTLAASASTFPIMTSIMQNLPLVLAALGSLVMIVMYTRWRQEGQE